jgi:hypothetical protein
MNFIKAGTSRTVAIALLLTAALPHEARAGAQDVASLYAPQPPASAVLLRVVNFSAQPARVVLAGGERVAALAPGAATRFSVVTPGTPLRVSVDGRTVIDAGSAAGSTNEAGRAPAVSAVSAVSAGTGSGIAGSAITVALKRDARGWHATQVGGRKEPIDGLKATLHVINFVTDCTAKIVVEGSGAVVFPQVEVGVQRDRAINPVSANLTGSCGAASSPAWTLPPLAAGDSYSLFLSGTRASPRLTGTRDAVAWPPPAD